MTARDRDLPLNSTGESVDSLLRHRHRRWALKCLAKAGGALHLADLARDVARVEVPQQGEPAVLDEAWLIYVQLYHNHAPRLDDAGIVSFDSEAKVVSLTAEKARVLSSCRHVTSPHALERRN